MPTHMDSRLLRLLHSLGSGPVMSLLYSHLHSCGGNGLKISFATAPLNKG